MAAKFGGPSYNSFRDICVTDRITESQNHRITDRITDSQKDNAEYIRSLEDRGNQLVYYYNLS